MKPNPHPVASSVRKRFLDLFERQNTSSGLGFANYGGVWDFIRGTFRINSFRAVANNNPEDYPVATISMPKEDVDINFIDIDNGSAVALWVTDSGNWFAVGVDQHPVDCNCSVGTECNRWNGSNITGWTTTETGGRNSYQEATGETCNTTETGGRNANWQQVCNAIRYCRKYIQGGRCVEWDYRTQCDPGIFSYNSPNFTTTCNTNFTTRYNSPNFTSNINGYNANLCNRWNEFLFDCETCYPQWIRIIQSAAGTVTTLSKYLISSVISLTNSPNGALQYYVQENPITEFVRSMILRIRGKEISVEPFSDPNLINQITLQDGEIIYEPTGATVEAKYGIMVVPSEYNQQNFIGGIEIDRTDI